MTIVISGTTGISGVDGSAGTPAVQGTDTNTGVFYPAADTVGISTGGSERMRVDSSGNVGIGTSSPSSFAKLAVQQVSGSNAIQLATTTNGAGIYWNLTNSGAILDYSYGTYRISGTSDAQPYLFVTNTTERMRIDSSGNVGIGTSSPGFKLELVNGYNNGLNIKDSTGTVFGGMFVESGQFAVRSRSNHPLVFSTNDVIRATIDTSGNFQFNSGYGSVATAYGCRAWVNFNGTGTVAIRASGNVTSITDNGVGDYTVNFTNAMPDANYCAVGCAGRANDGNNYVGFDTNTYSTTQVKFFTKAAGSAPSNTDMTGVYIAIFR